MHTAAKLKFLQHRGQKFTQFYTKFLDQLFPKHCQQCNIILSKNHTLFCADCYSTLPFHQHYCIRCGNTFQQGSISNTCGHCLNQAPPFDNCFCPFQYLAPIDALIRQFKYQNRIALSYGLAQILHEEIKLHNIPLPECLITVPSHRKKLRQRGYNPALLIARAFSHLSHVPLETHAIEKIRDTPPQASLSHSQRKTHIKGSFQMVKKIQAKHIAIIDDVITTGATAAEITKTLKSNGVETVDVWALARNV